ncbi:helix-turn-helix transcriptional regulator [Halorussus caseinilyticus]|uniref:Helix-turn-helix transcriptional regulator n=1 Tax=Halorussus caseinilyticus TaxID=3034025 RepID=A0ABD5WFM4_9EURY|nr:helix-turn-helix transcriptional regulator [Halorussus sp. DT72]
MTAEALPSLVDLHGFQRDVLFAVRALERGGDPPRGLRVKRRLEATYYEEVHHGRLYQNLDTLADQNLISKGAKDGRANEYATTDAARTILDAHVRARAEQAGVELANNEPDAFPSDETETETRSRGEQTELGDTPATEGEA